MEEDEVKRAVKLFLTASDWQLRSSPAHAQQGVDFHAVGKGGTWLIEAKGYMQQRSNFEAALGQVLMRMNDPNSKHSLAAPDMKNVRDWWKKFPQYPKTLLKISLLLVSKNGSVQEVN